MKAAALFVGVLSAALIVGCRPADAPRGGASNRTLSGVVTSLDATTLVVTRSGPNRGDMTFVLSPDTKREGAIGIGAVVQVRYRTDRGTQTATAVVALPPPEHQPLEKGP